MYIRTLFFIIFVGSFAVAVWQLGRPCLYGWNTQTVLSIRSNQALPSGLRVHLCLCSDQGNSSPIGNTSGNPIQTCEIGSEGDQFPANMSVSSTCFFFNGCGSQENYVYVYIYVDIARTGRIESPKGCCDIAKWCGTWNQSKRTTCLVAREEQAFVHHSPTTTQLIRKKLILFKKIIFSIKNIS